jgi:hypothetical protein
MVSKGSSSCGRRISARDLAKIVKYLAALPDDRTLFKVTWAMIASYAGISRQSLQAHSEIKKAYILAKQAFVARSNPRLLNRNRSKSSQDLINENIVLRARLEQLEVREVFWKQRWYRIAFNIRLHGLQMEHVDRVVPFTGPAMNIQEIQKILDSWNEPIPPVSS